MFPIEQSAFLQALGRAIGNSLWQVAAIWLLYTAITGLCTLSAARKYQLATTASLAGFFWFAGTFFYTYFNAPLPTAYSPVYSFAEANEIGNRSSLVNQALYLYHSVLASLKSLSPYISCAYLLVFLLLGIRLVNGFRQVKFFSTQGLGKVDVQWRLFVQRNAEILQIKQTVKVFSSHYIQSPLTMGFWKPIILLPVASLNNLSTQQVEAILLHELAHIRRHDYLINIFVQVAEICLFFNPFMRLLLKQIRQERENSCDDYVLQFQYNATDYAKALLAIEKNNSATLLALSAKDNQSFQLLNRVKRMVAPQPHAFNYKQQLFMLLLLTILGLGFTVIVPKPKLKSPVADTNWSYKNSLKEWAANGNPVNTAAHQTPAPPAAFDLVKTIQGIQNFAENIDLKEVEAQGKALGAKAEEFGKTYAEHMERAMQPYVDEVTKWADKYAENNEALERLEAAAKNFEGNPLNYATPLSNFDEYLTPVMIKLNEALKTFPRINVNINPPTFPVTPVAPLRPANLPAMFASPRVGFSRDLDEVRASRNMVAGRVIIDKEKLEKMQQRGEAEAEKGKVELNKALDEASAQYKQQIIKELKTLNDQHLELAYQYSALVNTNGRSINRGIDKCTCPAAVIAADKDTDNDDEDENGNNTDDAGNTSQSSPKAKIKHGQPFAYTFRLPEMPEFKEFPKSFHIQWNNTIGAKERKLNRSVVKKVVASASANDDEHVVNDIQTEVLEADINADDIKNIDIKRQKRSKNGKEENVVIIRITTPAR